MACSTIVATRPPGRDETRASFGSQVILCKNDPPLKTRSGTATRSAACPAPIEENWRRPRRAGTKAGAGAFPAPLHMKIWSEFKSCLRTDFRKAPPQKCEGAYPFRPTDNLTARCPGQRASALGVSAAAQPWPRQIAASGPTSGRLRTASAAAGLRLNPAASPEFEHRRRRQAKSMRATRNKPPPSVDLGIRKSSANGA